jgi:hypothetical protein
MFGGIYNIKFMTSFLFWAFVWLLPRAQQNLIHHALSRDGCKSCLYGERDLNASKLNRLLLSWHPGHFVSKAYAYLRSSSGLQKKKNKHEKNYNAIARPTIWWKMVWQSRLPFFLLDCSSSCINVTWLAKRWKENDKKANRCERDKTKQPTTVI